MKIYKFTVSKYFTQRTTLGEVLSSASKLERPILEKAAAYGAVWLQKNGKGKILKNRSLDTLLDAQDVVSFFYDPKVLRLPEVTNAISLFEHKHYGIWVKPAGVVPQGSQAGDQASLLRCVEKIKKKEVFLIHRLDRETEGVMIVGYSSEGASKLSDLFQKNKIQKVYQTVVLGEIPVGEKRTINASLDDKEAITHFVVLDSKNNQSLLEVRIETGRLHQIRRHLDHIGHPIIGDPKYGKGNKNKEGLKLLAYSLSFLDPWDKCERTFSLNKSLSL